MNIERYFATRLSNQNPTLYTFDTAGALHRMDLGNLAGGWTMVGASIYPYILQGMSPVVFSPEKVLLVAETTSGYRRSFFDPATETFYDDKDLPNWTSRYRYGFSVSRAVLPGYFQNC